jgi:hypothetical protein
LDNLEAYLLSKEVFWSLGKLPSLSLGRMFWDLTVLQANKKLLSSEAAADLVRLEREYEIIRRKWRVAWERKSVAELRSRVNLWRAYLQELAELPEEAQAYAHEVRNRALADYLLGAAGNQSEARPFRDALEALDSRLRAVFDAGDFVWDSELAPVFPADTHWYLYGRPSTR